MGANGSKKAAKAKDPAMVAMGKRLKQAALAAGYKTAEDLARQLGVSNQTIYRWWNANHDRLPPARVKEYARIVGVTDVWLWTGKNADGMEEVPEESELDRIVSARAADLLLDLLERVARGDDAGAAWDTVSPAPEELSPREHRLLSLDTPRLRSGLAALADVAPADLEALSNEDLRAALQQALSLAKHFRGQ